MTLAPRRAAGRPALSALATLVVALGLASVATQASAQQQVLPLRVDCGDLNGDHAPEAGWQLLGEGNPLPGIGFLPAPLDTVHVAGKAPDGSIPVGADVWAVDPDELGKRHRLTSLMLADPTMLVIAGLPASQPLRVRLELGALGPWADVSGDGFELGPSTSSSGILVEELRSASPLTWRSVARDVRCLTGAYSASYKSALGGLVSVWVLAHSDGDGRLVLRFSSTASDGADPIYLAGFEVHEHEALPVVYHQQGGAGPLVAQMPQLHAFAAAFNAADYDAAEEAAAALADPFQRGVARCWLAGWLDGSRDGRFHLLPLARADLTSAAASHAAAPWLVSQLDDLRRALAHLDARGYEWAQACPSEGGYGFLNPDCAGQTVVLGAQGHALTNVQGHAALRRFAGLCTPAAGSTIRADVDAWNAAPIGYGGWEPGPFLFAAAKQSGVTISMINPLLDVKEDDPESVAFLDSFRATFLVALTGGGFETANFPRDMELPLFRAYAEQASHPMEWTDETVEEALSDEQIEASWWGPLVAKQPADPGIPGWINMQRDALTAYRSAVEYWLHQRLVQGELGGGLGDDVEALLQFYPLYALRQDPDDGPELAAIDALVRWVLADSGEVTDGYFSGGMTDVEHAAEYTTNAFQALRADLGYTAAALETAVGVGDHFQSPAAPEAAWMGMTALGRLHFKSYKFTAAGPSPDSADAFDIPLDGRATYPGVATADRGVLPASHPLVGDLTRWASAWRDDALATTGGKPKGFFGPVGFPSNQFGGSGKWWTLGNSAADKAVWQTGEASYILELLRTSYRQSTSPDRWRYLLPIVRVLRAVKDWEDAGKPNGPPGTTTWVASQFFGSPRFFPIVATSVGDLANDKTLTTTDDPDLAGTEPYVDAALLERLHDWVETTPMPALNLALRYALQPVSDCGSGSTAKSPAIVEFTYNRAIKYWRAVFPLLTNHVLHTDRLFLNRNGILGHLATGHTGSVLTEGLLYRPAVTWRSEKDSLDALSISCNSLTYDGTGFSAFLYHPGPEPLSLELQLDEGLEPGFYLLELGPAQATCDAFPGGKIAFQVDKPGAGVRVPLQLDPGLQLLRLTRRRPPDPPAQRWDLALDAPRLVYAGGVLGLRTRVVNGGAQPSPAATLRLYVTLLDPTGQPVAPVADHVLYYTAMVPALVGSSGYDLASVEPAKLVPIVPFADLVMAGYGLEFTAEVTAGDTQWDPLNDQQSRRYFRDDLLAAMMP